MTVSVELGFSAEELAPGVAELLMALVKRGVAECSSPDIVGALGGVCRLGGFWVAVDLLGGGS